MQEYGIDVQSRIDGVRRYLVEQFELTNDQIEGMLPVFIDTLHGHMKELEKLAVADDIPGMNKMAHTLKGALLNLGLKDLADTALKLEKFDPEKESLKKCNDMVDDLSNQVLSLHI